MNTRRAGTAALIAVAVSLVFGVNSASAASRVKPPPAPDGYVTTPVKAAGFTFAIPDTWLALDPKSPAAEATLAAGVAKNPKLGSAVDQFKSMRSSIKFWALDAGATSFAANVLVLPTPYDKSIVNHLATIKTSLEAALGDLPDSLSVRKVRIGGVNAAEADATLKLTASDGTRGIAYATIFFLPTTKGLIDIDYTSSVPPESDTTLQTMAKSLRLS